MCTAAKTRPFIANPVEHYDYWKAELPEHELPMGVFGENFTIEGFAEESVHIGDRFSIGSAEVVVTQPRLPCYKLGIRFESDNVVRQFLGSRRTGFYLAVTREGEVGANDEIILLSHDPESVSVSAVTQLYLKKTYGGDDVRAVRQALTVEALPQSWKDYFEEQLPRLIS